MHFIRIMLIVIFVVGGFAACDRQDNGNAPSASGEIDYTESVTSSEISNENGYPPVIPPTPIVDSYPSIVEEPDAYPPPSVEYDESKRFTINEPLVVGEVMISGQGPANVAIKIINVSYVGEVLGFGTTDSNGNFSITSSTPFEANHIIGIQLADQNLEDDFRDGPGYTNMPMIGLILDTAVIQP